MQVKRYLTVVFFWLIAGCQAQQIIVNGTFSSPQRTYTLTLPKEGWSPLRQKHGADIAMQRLDAGGATFAVFSHRQQYEHLPLNLLQTHLFIGIRHRRTLDKQHVTISNHRALHAVLVGEVGGREIRLSSYVIAKNGLVYDLVYWAPPDHFDSALGDFERMVESFVFLDEKVNK